MIDKAPVRYVSPQCPLFGDMNEEPRKIQKKIPQVLHPTLDFELRESVKGVRVGGPVRGCDGVVCVRDSPSLGCRRSCHVYQRIHMQIAILGDIYPNLKATHFSR